jgi:mono/diheme cytochrome c family protein
VGLGSFLVNAVAGCNGCHTGGGPLNFNYAARGNPYFGQPTKTDATTYLEGGTGFFSNPESIHHQNMDMTDHRIEAIYEYL